MAITNRLKNLVFKFKSSYEDMPGHKVQGAASIKAPGVVNRSARLSDLALSESVQKKLDEMRIRLEEFIKADDSVEVIIMMMNIKNLSPTDNLTQLLGDDLYDRCKEITSGK